MCLEHKLKASPRRSKKRTKYFTTLSLVRSGRVQHQPTLTQCCTKVWRLLSGALWIIFFKIKLIFHFHKKHIPSFRFKKASCCNRLQIKFSLFEHYLKIVNVFDQFMYLFFY